MMTAHGTTNRAGRRSGFTLIEVLIATFILALGSLGLIVLFAGAATQQQRSAQLDQSVFVSQNAEAMMARRFGSIDGPGLSLLNPGEWYRLPARVIPGNPGVGTLSIDPTSSGNFFFRLEEPNDVLLYKRDATGPWMRTTGWTSVSTAPDGLGSAGHPRVVANTMRIEIVFSANPMMPATVVPPPLVLEKVSELVGNPNPVPPSWPARREDPNDDRVVFAPGGAFVGGPGQSFVMCEFTVDNDPLAPGSAQSDQPTRLVSIDVAAAMADPNLTIEEVRLLGGFEYLASDIISLDDRVVHVNDDDYPLPLPGRPAAAYALLYRTASDGVSSQIAAFTYTISGGGAGTAYAPDEEADVNAGVPNLLAPVQAIDARLHFDSTLKQYYIQPRQADDSWIIEPGQLLLVAGDVTKPGADFAVRVLSQRSVGGQVRGYLDRVPRAGGQALIDDRTTSQTVVVWAVQPIVQNIDVAGGASVRWRLTPQEVRVFQL